ncbi:MAG: FAD-binding domain-containing protein [Woeseiaceae bacterium]|nr:FAD-binding domain-containing protein [Woeseiaceae bacterium]
MLLAAPQASREAGLARLEGFVPQAGPAYARSRNFDYGPERRDNVSVLSPWIRHRLIVEHEVLDAVLGRHTLSAAGKFVQEVFWRAYFKGALEHRPTIWFDYREGVDSELARLDRDRDLFDRYEQATTGATGIDCFDAWAGELVRTGYLHNHTRMWFASIWIYTLKLPWQLGADFFLRHLVDGDPASNTLSWRWVCGLHTRGKTYLARVSNITSYTDGRFNPQGQLAVTAPPLNEDRVHPRRRLRPADAPPDGGRIGLLVTEEDGHPESLFGRLAPTALTGLVATSLRSPRPVGLAARDFAAAAVNDAVARAGKAFDLPGGVVETGNWSRMLTDWATEQRLESIVTAYAPVGPVAELLAEARPRLAAMGVQLHELRRAYDSAAWPHATRGYFKLKDRIPSILGRLDVAGFGGAAQDAAG